LRPWGRAAIFGRDRLFDHAAMQKIEAHSPAYRKLHRDERAAAG